MKKQSFIAILLTVLMSLTGAKAFAYDIAVANNDGVTIYYKWANEEKTELSVSSHGGYNYSGNVIIPKSVVYEGNTYRVTSIGDRAFQNCSGLTTITIGSGVKNIGSQAFAKCAELADVYCYAETVPTTNTDAFEESYINYATLHVPTASIDAYKAVEPWASFKTIMGLDGTMPEEPEVKKCATPTISIVDGELEFSCETEGVEYVSEVTSKEVKKYYDSKVKISGTYTVSVYAMKTGWENSDVATLEFTVGADGTGVLGDVNGDGIVDVSDYIGVANIILTGTVDGKKE